MCQQPPFRFSVIFLGLPNLTFLFNHLKGRRADDIVMIILEISHFDEFRPSQPNTGGEKKWTAQKKCNKY